VGRLILYVASKAIQQSLWLALETTHHNYSIETGLAMRLIWFSGQVMPGKGEVHGSIFIG